jgi:hypothetical protein
MMWRKSIKTRYQVNVHACVEAILTNVKQMFNIQLLADDVNAVVDGVVVSMHSVPADIKNFLDRVESLRGNLTQADTS